MNEKPFKSATSNYSVPEDTENEEELNKENRPSIND